MMSVCNIHNRITEAGPCALCIAEDTLTLHAMNEATSLPERYTEDDWEVLRKARKVLEAEPAPRPAGKNEHGLDMDYFRKNLEILVRDLERYTPDEMGRALDRLARVAAPRPAAPARTVVYDLSPAEDVESEITKRLVTMGWRPPKQGFVLVPREPTEAMIGQFQILLYGRNMGKPEQGTAKTVWQAMIEAAEAGE